MKRSRLGFTIAEVMVGCGIMAVVGLAVVKLISNARATSAIAECRGALRMSCQLSAKQLQRDIASSRAIPDTKDKKKYVMSIEPGSPEGPTVVTMQAPIIGEDGSLESSEDATYFDSNTAKEDETFEKVTYELSGGVLRRVGEKSGSLKLGTNIKSVEFAKNEINGIEISYDGKIEATITAKAKPDGQKDEIEYKETIIASVRALQNKNLKEEDDRKFKRRIDKNDF